MTKDFRASVDAGGTHIKSGPSYPEGAATPKQWPKTHERWVRLRKKGHNRPLILTGGYRDSFGYHVQGRSVFVGSSHIGSRRFHWGDAHFGKRWRWAAPVDDSGAISNAGGRIRWFSPVIQERKVLALWGDTKDAWWREDVGGALGIHA